MRHSKSCSNHVRSGDSDPNIVVSKEIRDPGLSTLGSSAAHAYASILRRRLAEKGFELDRAFIGASALRRAQDTARIVFGRDRIATLPHFTENGQIPENTPAGRPYAAPNWPRFVAHLSTLVTEGQSVAVVGHGSFLLSLWPRLTGSPRSKRLNNLDGILLDADIDSRGLRVHSFEELHAPVTKGSSDTCGIPDMQKISVIRKRMTRKQKGGNGSTGMPLAYFQDGAQMRGTTAAATGVGLAGSWFRAPLHQTGGSRRRTRRQRGGFGSRAERGRHSLRSQNGGFTPSIMGSFASNGMQLLPVAGYMGYKMYSNQKRRTRGSRRR
jgi:phosphohistidine phosphatase SixA